MAAATLENLQRRPVIDLKAGDVAELMNRCFEGYVVAFQLTAELADRRFRKEHLDTVASAGWYDGDQPAAIALIARRGWTCRLAAMAVAPDFRRKGVGTAVMEATIDEARVRGDRRFILEVIEQNPPAIALYASVGFTVSRRLVGLERPPAPGISAKLTEVDPAEFCRQLVRYGPQDLSWDLDPANLMGMASPSQAFALEDQAWALVTPTAGPTVVLWSVLTHPDARRTGQGRRLIEALQAQWPEKALKTPVTVPQELCPKFWDACGFTEIAISQFEMTMAL